MLLLQLDGGCCCLLAGWLGLVVTQRSLPAGLVAGSAAATCSHVPMFHSRALWPFLHLLRRASLRQGFVLFPATVLLDLAITPGCGKGIFLFQFLNSYVVSSIELINPFIVQ